MTPRYRIQDGTKDLRQASKAFADRIDAIAEEVTRARDRLGKGFRRVEAAMAEAEESAETPNARVTSALDALGAEARRSFERIVTRKKPRRFLFW
jgi:predicted  nucleic acid-binding Zn-ribbon protein